MVVDGAMLLYISCTDAPRVGKVSVATELPAASRRVHDEGVMATALDVAESMR